MSASIARSSGNVYADLGFKNPEEHALKAELVRLIATVMRAQGLTQTATARRLGIAQPDVSRMLKGRFRQFSVERLLRFLVASARTWRSWCVPPSAAEVKAAARLTITSMS